MLIRIVLGAVALYVGICAAIVLTMVVALAVEQMRLRLAQLRHREVVGQLLVDPVEAAYSDAVGIALAPTLRDDPISLLRMHIAVDACLDRARDGQDITEDAPKEWVP